MKKTIVIGFDGTSPDLIKNWVNQGKLPNFSKIIAQGVHGNLQTTMPPLTPCAWSSFMTGTNPGKHGIYDFFYLDKNHQIEINTANSRHSKDIWEYLSESGFRNLVFNVPFTYPPKKINGIMVSGFTTPSTDADFTHPPSLKEKILLKYPQFKCSEKSKYAENPKARLEFKNEVLDLADLRFQIVNELIEENDCDFYMITFMAADHIQHWYWKYMDRRHPEYVEDVEYEKTIENTYSKLDFFLGEFMKKFSGHNIILMSDHGSGPYYKDVTLNNWLIEQGYLFLQKDHSFFKKLLSSIGVSKLISFGLNIGLWKIIKKSSKIKNFIQKKMMLTYQDIDWKKTKAFSYGYYGPIFINKNVVNSPQMQKTLKEEIKEKLLKIKIPQTDKPLIDDVWYKEDLYKGEMVDILPDLIINMGNFAYASSSSFPFSSPSLFSAPKTFKTGDHSFHGTFMAYGPDIKKGLEIKDAKIYDLAPTILYMFNIEPPDYMDGRILKEIFEENANFIAAEKKLSQEHASKQQGQNLSDDEKKIIEERLRNLGYF